MAIDLVGRRAVLWLGCWGAVLAPALAQDYPNRAVELQVPFAAGGTTDLIGRIMAEALTQSLGQPVVVVNRAGAGGSVGAAETARAKPDGYRLAISSVSSMAANPAMNPKTAYDPIRDFTPIINIAATPNVIAVHPSFPARDYAGFVQELKARPGAYSYASSGTGGLGQLLMELYKSLTGTFITHIPYRGAGPMLNDVVAGQVPIVLDNLPTALPFIKSGRLVPIVVSGVERSRDLPAVPTFQEVGLASANRFAFYGIIGPKGLPDDVVTRVHAAARQALEKPEVRKRIEDTGSRVVGNSPAEFASQLQAELDIYRSVVARQGLKMD